MLILTATDQSITLVTGAAVSTDYIVSWADNTASTFTPGSGQGNITTATTTAVMAAPGASTQRAVKGIMITNRHASSSQTVQLFKLVGASSYAISQNLTLLAGQTAVYNENGLSILTASQLFVASGKLLQAQNSLNLIGTDGTSQTFPTTNSVIARTDAAQTFTGVQTYSGRVLVDDTTDATTATDGSLQTDGGLSVAKSIYSTGSITSSKASSLTSGGDFASFANLNATPASSSSASFSSATFTCSTLGTNNFTSTSYSVCGFNATVNHYSTGTCERMIGAKLISQQRVGAGSTTYCLGAEIQCNNLSTSQNMVLASGLYIKTSVDSGGGITYNHGIYIEAVSAGTNKYAIYANAGISKLTDSTASTSTTTGALVVTGGIATSDYFTGKHRSSNGTAGTTLTRTFYTASSSGGAVNVLNTVTILDGIITAWTQA